MSFPSARHLFKLLPFLLVKLFYYSVLIIWLYYHSRVWDNIRIADFMKQGKKLNFKLMYFTLLASVEQNMTSEQRSDLRNYSL